MPLFSNKDKDKKEPNRTELVKIEEERYLLANLQRGTEIGDFVTICRTDYVQAFSDPWIANYNYVWTEYLLLVKNLLQSPTDLSALVYLPQDLSEVYYVVVPAQAPDYRWLTAQGRMDYELAPGYEGQVNGVLARDYGSLARRSVFHSVDMQPGWDMIVEAVLAGQMQSVALEYNGVKYVYALPKDKKEAEASAFTAAATRRGAYPMEESLRSDRKFDIVPSIPDGVTGRVTVREFLADPKTKAPFQRLSFQRTEVPPGSVPADQPRVMTNLSFGNELGPNESLSHYLSIKYVQVNYQNPAIKILGQF